MVVDLAMAGGTMTLIVFVESILLLVEGCLMALYLKLEHVLSLRVTTLSGREESALLLALDYLDDPVNRFSLRVSIVT